MDRGARVRRYLRQRGQTNKQRNKQTPCRGQQILQTASLVLEMTITIVLHTVLITDIHTKIKHDLAN